MEKAMVASLSIILCLVCLPRLALGQLVEELHQTKDGCCLQSAAQSLADQLQDWNQLSHYYEDDERLQTQPPQQGRVVFLGDSITAIWDLPRFFGDRPYVNRGIGGQTTQQMLVRVFPDVIDLKPGAMIILGGINDIDKHTGPETAKMVEENLQAMTELAQKHGVKVVLCSLLPVRGEWARYLPDVLKLNAWIKQYSLQAQVQFADYYVALADSHGMLKKELTTDGIHPTPVGQALMAPIAEAAIEKALR